MVNTAKNNCPNIRNYQDCLYKNASTYQRINVSTFQRINV